MYNSLLLLIVLLVGSVLFVILKAIHYKNKEK